MKTKTKAALILIIITPFLTELLSSNMPPRVLFTTLPLLLLIFAYGLPVLLLRELAVRWRLGLLGILSLGMAYGILNEGIWAKTLLFVKDVPVNAFDNYGFFLGINFSWAAVMLIWHTFHSVLFPILIVHYLYPAVKLQPWLGKKAVIATILPSSALAILTFFKTKPELGGWPYLLIFSLSMLAFVLIAKFMPKATERVMGRFSFKPLLLGVSVVILYIISLALASEKIPLAIFFLYLTVAFLSFALVLRKKGWLAMPSLLLFALGDYMAHAAFGGFSMFTKGYIDGIFSAAIFMIIFIIAILRIKERFKMSSGENGGRKKMGDVSNRDRC